MANFKASIFAYQRARPFISLAQVIRFLASHFIIKLPRSPQVSLEVFFMPKMG